MKSPFPGMDPWLEKRWRWPDIHHGLLGLFRRLLVPQLGDQYVAEVELTTYYLPPDDPAARKNVPDVRIVREAVPAYQVHGARGIEPPTAVLTMPELIEVRERRIVIRKVGQRRVVTWIELLSPTNKEPGSAGRRQYLNKRNRTFKSQAHIAEIDLLRRGARLPFFEELPRGDFFAFVSRGNKRPECEVYAARLPRALPVIPIPLYAPDKDARLDLQEALDMAYAEARWDLTAEYGQPPDPPLTAAQMKWARTRIATWRRTRNGKS